MSMQEQEKISRKRKRDDTKDHTESKPFSLDLQDFASSEKK